MKNIFLTAAILIVASTITIAQTHTCGTLDQPSKWLKKFQQRLDQPNFQKNLDQELFVPLTIHIVGEDDGTGYVSISKLLDALCTLNADFEDWNMQFFIQGNIRYINNSDWYRHDNFDSGRPMIRENNVPNTMNCFFVNLAAGIASGGYAGLDSYYTVVTNSATQASNQTWAHEIGHALSLPHTFEGWEAKRDTDFNDYDFTLPAPDTIFYRGRDIPTELLDGSNCREAADGFCDTKSDYLYSFWSCNNNDRSTRRQVDPTGASFTSDGSLIMSQAGCTSRFSEEQALAMRANLREQKNGLGNTPIELDIITNLEVTALLPESGALAPNENITLEWTPVENATHYILQVSRLPTFPIFDVNEVVEGNSFNIESLQLDRRYYWRVRPFNYYSSCAGFSDRFTFTTSEFTATDRTIEESIAVAPNLVSSGEDIFIQFGEGIHYGAVVTLVDLNGRVLDQQQFNKVNSRNVRYPIRVTQAGMYFLSITIGKYHIVKKLVVQ